MQARDNRISGEGFVLCRNVMKPDVGVIAASDDVAAAAARMRELNAGFLPVFEKESRQLIGTITDRDIAVRVVADRKPAETPVRDAMTPDPVYCNADDDVARAEELMAQFKVSRIICIDQNRSIAGVLSLSDIAQLSSRDAAKTLTQVSQRETEVR
jgi:CBS domain-containing protein